MSRTTGTHRCHRMSTSSVDVMCEGWGVRTAGERQHERARREDGETDEGPGARVGHAAVQQVRARGAEYERRERVTGDAERPHRVRLAPAQHEQRDAREQEEEPE